MSSVASPEAGGAADEDAVYFRDCGAKLVALAVYPLKLFADVPRSKLRSVEEIRDCTNTVFDHDFVVDLA